MKKGDKFAASFHSTSRDEKYFKNSDKFDIDRWDSPET